MIGLLLALLALASAVPSRLTYNVGDDYSFAFASFLNHSAQSDVQGTQGSLSTMNGVMEIECQQWDGKLFYFVMNLFNVDVEAQNGQGQGLGKKPLTVGDDGLGLDMFFSMTPSGQIPQIWYQDGDSPFFINVKASAISSLQTNIVPPSQKTVIQEADLIGTHKSNFNAAVQASVLNVYKSFTQQDVIKYADAAVSQATFQLVGLSTVQIDPAGFIRQSNTAQSVLFRSVLSSEASQKRVPEIGFDGNLFSHGMFELILIPNTQMRLSAEFSKVSKVQTSLMEIGTTASQVKRTAKITTAQQLIFTLENNPKNTDYQQLRQIANLFEVQPAFLVEAAPVVIAEVQKADKSVLLNRFLFALGIVDTIESNLILHQMLAIPSIQIQVAQAITTSRVTDCSLIPVVQSLVKGAKQGREVFLLAFGSLTRRCGTTDSRQKAASYFSQLLAQAEKSNDGGLFSAIQGAMQNAGLPAPFVAGPSTMPFNKSFSQSLQVGGSVLSATFEIDAFIGTNFDCNQKYFNYLADAEASATVDFLGTTKSAFDAKAVYGKVNGASAGDQIYVRVWDDVVYNVQLPQVDCAVHTYPIGNWQAPGLDVTYTIWISVIPVTFTAVVDASLVVDWSYQVCDSSLSVNVQLIPDAKLAVAASAQSDLIIIEGGIIISANFEMTPRPQAFITGSECEIGFDIDATYDPMDAALDVYWRENVCEFWIFDCHWGPYHTDVLWSYNAGQKNVVLLKETWKIAK